MSLIVKSSTKINHVLVVGDGFAHLEISGRNNHLNNPYLLVEYVPPHTKGRIYSSYKVTGLLFGLNSKSVTTNKLLKMLGSLGFQLSSNALREAITPPDVVLNKVRRSARARRKKNKAKIRSVA